jgi:hypothetical protein
MHFIGVWIILSAHMRAYTYPGKYTPRLSLSVAHKLSVLLHLALRFRSAAGFSLLFIVSCATAAVNFVMRLLREMERERGERYTCARDAIGAALDALIWSVGFIQIGITCRP